MLPPKNCPPPNSEGAAGVEGGGLLPFYHFIHLTEIVKLLNLHMNPKTIGAHQGNVQTRHLDAFSAADVIPTHILSVKMVEME